MRVSSAHRPGKILALFTVLLPVLLGMVGLVIDTGLLLAAHRQSQNAADAAALAAAQDVLAGKTDPEAAATATTYVQQYNGLAGATVSVNRPPTEGPYAGNAAYVEVIVTANAGTWFIQVLGSAPSQLIRTRAVAGIEAVQASDTVAMLDPAAAPGLSISGGVVQVNGQVTVNALGAGFDAQGNWVNLGSPAYAVTLDSASQLRAPAVQVVGGVNAPANVQNTNGTASPLRAGALLRSDPLLYLPPPTTANGVQNSYPGVNGATFATPQSVAVSVTGNQSVTFSPGVYASITVTGAGPGSVTFSPGIYVLLGGSNGSALNLSTGATVTGNGVLFYNTGSNYSVTTGWPDASDGNTLGTDAGAPSFGTVTVNAATVSLTPLCDPSSPFDGLVFYQRRWNRSAVTLQSNSSSDVIAGTLYARWVAVGVSGPGTFSGQFLAGSMSVNGPLTITRGSRLAKASQTFLVE